jgi:multisubunit Na+/H+ antiporter MnhG subunit
MFRYMRRQMPWKQKVAGGVLTVLGFMLSPLSWWNDAFVNLPLALAFAWLVSSVCAESWKVAVFDVALIVGYWLTNLLGFVLMHRGARQMLVKTALTPGRSGFKKDLLVSLGYTALIVLLIKFGVLKPIEYYFSGN